MARDERQTKKIVSEEKEMRKRYKMLLRLDMVEMVQDLDLLGNDAAKEMKLQPEKKEQKK